MQKQRKPQAPQIKKSSPVYDVVIIGSGASGGMAAWNLTRKGINVLLLDAGDKYDPAKYWMAMLPYERREAYARGEKPELGFLDTKEQPYLTQPGNRYDLYRVWGHGGWHNPVTPWRSTPSRNTGRRLGPPSKFAAPSY